MGTIQDIARDMYVNPTKTSTLNMGTLTLLRAKSVRD